MKKPKVLIISTGGTISSKYSTEKGYSPTVTAQELSSLSLRQVTEPAGDSFSCLLGIDKFADIESLTMSERECILLLHHNQEDITQIAQVLGRNKSTISRELCRNTEKHDYSAHEPQNSYTIRRRTCKPQLKATKPENHMHIVSGLEQYWFPEQIIGHMA